MLSLDSLRLPPRCSLQAKFDSKSNVRGRRSRNLMLLTAVSCHSSSSWSIFVSSQALKSLFEHSVDHLYAKQANIIHERQKAVNQNEREVVVVSTINFE